MSEERVTLGRPTPDTEWTALSDAAAESARKAGYEVRAFLSEQSVREAVEEVEALSGEDGLRLDPLLALLPDPQPQEERE